MKMDLETYLTINGASRQDFGDSALHKNRGNHSNKTWSKIVDRQAEKDRLLAEKRENLRQEYYQKVASGEIEQFTRLERLQLTASGNPENEATQAAIRLLEKYKQQEKNEKKI